MAVAGVPWRTEADRLPLRPGRPAAGRPHRAARARRLRPRRDLVLDLARGGRRSGRRPGTCSATSGPPTCSAGFSGSPALAPLAGLRDIEWSLNTYATGRLAVQVVPMLMSDEIWQHPLCAAFDDDLRDRLRAAAADSIALAAEADALPYLLSHGDACPNNLLAGEPTTTS